MYNNADKLQNIRPGDSVERLLCGMLPMQLVVTAVTQDRIICGAWEFSRTSGAEIDEELGWTDTETGSYIRPVTDDVVQQ
jgi:hypothetical protein